MTEAWLRLLQDHGWSVPLKEAVWCTTAANVPSDWTVIAQGVKVEKAAQNVGFKVLGVRVAFNNSFGAELKERFSKAWRAFYSHRDLLCCTQAPFSKRIELLETLVASSLFWCSGSWNLTRGQESKLRGLQQNMLRKMLGWRPFSSESKSDYMERLCRRLKHLKNIHGIRSWDKTYLRSVFAWAGHVARIPQYDSSRITHKTMIFKNWGWIKSVAANNDGNQLHGRKLRTWRWERPMTKYYSRSPWEEAAQDKDFWTSKLDDMVQWWCDFR